MTERAAPDWLTVWEFAHRGLHGPGVPENSLVAAEGAIARGIGIECDVQMSADGVPLVFHDWDLARLTENEGLVGAFCADALQAMTLRGTGQNPPRLELFLATIAGRVPLLIEIKSMPAYDVERSCRAVAQEIAEYVGAIAVMSFDPRVPRWFSENAPDTVRGLVGTDSHKNGFEGVWREPRALAAAAPDFLAIDVRDLDRPEAAAWRAGGKPLLTWTIRSPEMRVAGIALADALIAEGAGLT
jgi:glycerophosphoryl diester phosphodiesterase